jgi:hypothetical protein
MKIILVTLVVTVALSSVACQKTILHSVLQEQALPSQAVEAAEPQYLHHTVQWPGETLSHIAQWYTGRIQNWQTIAAHNRTMDLNTLRKGDIILIPQSILITHESMPADIVHPTKTKPKSKTLRTAPKPRPVPLPDNIPEPISLFEPVESVSAPPEVEPGGREEFELFEPIP